MERIRTRKGLSTGLASIRVIGPTDEPLTAPKGGKWTFTDKPKTKATKARRSIRKITRHEVPGVITKVKPVSPAPTRKAPVTPEPSISDVGAVGLRAAFGLGNQIADVERTAREATSHVRRAAKELKAAPPAAPVTKAAPRQAPITEVTLHAALFQSVHRRFVAAGHLPVTLSQDELAAELGTTPQAVASGLTRLVHAKQLRQSGNAFHSRFEPVT